MTIQARWNPTMEPFTPSAQACGQLAARPTTAAVIERARFNPRPTCLLQAGSTAHAVQELILAHPDRFFTCAQLVATTGRTTKSVDWALIYLRVKRQIEAFGLAANGSYRRYRLMQPLRALPPLTDLRHFNVQPKRGIVETTPAPKGGRAIDVNSGVGASALLLLTWIGRYCRDHHSDTVVVREVLRRGPAEWRNKALLTDALQKLVRLEKVTLIRDGRKNVVKLTGIAAMAIRA